MTSPLLHTRSIRVVKNLAGLALLAELSCASGTEHESTVQARSGGVAGSDRPAAESGNAPALGGAGSVDTDVSLGGLTSFAGVAGASDTSDCSAADCDIGCGNGRIDPGLQEACDDGNNLPGDGCSADCGTVETDFACPEPGSPCKSTVVCGDGRVSGAETCDDGNDVDGDGCSSACTIEQNFSCPQPGQPCTALCGDGVLAGNEACDPPNPGLGCSELCQVEPGYVCAQPPVTPDPNTPAECHQSVCGDGSAEGDEACDDGNDIDGDGCSASCSLEPDCSDGPCVSQCGDAVLLAPEECDDGNVSSGDGCSADCQLETGYSCVDDAGTPPDSLKLLAIYRDFVTSPAAGTPRHPDFEIFEGADVTESLALSALDAEGKPALDGRCSDADPASILDPALCPYGQMLTTETNFSAWYRDVSGVNLAVPGSLLLPQMADGSYAYDSGADGFYPIDGQGFVATGEESPIVADPIVNDGGLHNFGFTTEIRYFFQYRGGESLSFSGDDDVWVFINRALALDVGGLHPRTDRTLNVDQQAAGLGLDLGGLYEIALFHAERHSAASNFQLTLTGFSPTQSVCGPTCGDGVVVASEECDLGSDLNVGAYNGCTEDCKRGPRCGDGVVQDGDEECDDGVNLTTYSMTGAPGCAPGCVQGGFCGDASVDSLFGEQCDLGAELNGQADSACTETCQLGARCGDGILQRDRGEECDDGNTVSGDGCSKDCTVVVF